MIFDKRKGCLGLYNPRPGFSLIEHHSWVGSCPLLHVPNLNMVSRSTTCLGGVVPGAAAKVRQLGIA